MTDLYSAFSPLSGGNNASDFGGAGAPLGADLMPTDEPPRQQPAAAPRPKAVSTPKQLPAPTPMPALYDGGATFNKQFEQEQKIAMLVNELKRRKGGSGGAGEESYFDKLMGKKKELMKFLQSGLIVLFAFSAHFVIDHYLKYYLESNTVSFEREVFIRVLYPVAILFLAWNLITFNK